MKKILFIAPGNSPHSYRWINYFKLEYNLHWLSAHKFKKEFDLKNKTCFDNLLLSPIQILLYSLKQRPDIIHIHSVSRYLFISFLILIFFKKKIILTPWGSDIFFPNRFTKVIQNFFFKESNFICDSFLLQKKIQGYHKNNIVNKINFGINCNFFKKKNYSNIKQKIIFCPRGYDDVYNNKLILKMIYMVKNKIRNYKFVFLGRPGKLMDQNIKMSKKLQIYNKCKFLGFVNQKELKYYYNISTAVISASKSDAGISSSIAEAMACQKIVLITDNRDNPFWVKNNFNGFLFKNNNLASLAQQFLKIINLKKNEKKKIEFNARQTQLKKNNIITEMNKVKKIYNST